MIADVKITITIEKVHIVIFRFLLRASLGES